MYNEKHNQEYICAAMDYDEKALDVVKSKAGYD
jgi:hypothetical protein